MAEVRITMNDVATQKRLNALIRKVPKLAINPLSLAIQYIAGQSQKIYLRGPRPERLGVKTGRLRNSISSKVAIEGGDIVGYVGTNVVSPGGFNYPGFWENRGRHGVPRPFLKPARDDTRAKWNKIFLDNFKSELLKWLSHE